MSLKFVTLFPGLLNIHLRKGLGKIPFVLHRNFGYESTLICFKNEPEYPSLKNDIPGVQLQFFKYPFSSHPLLASIWYIITSAGRVDVLNLYGQSRYTFIIGLLFKILRPKGILYIKLDMNIEYLHRLKNSKNVNRHLWFWKFYFSKVASIVSSEYEELTKALIEFYGLDAQKIIQIPNGIDEKAIEKLPFKRLSFEQKENIILAVGRIGIAEKNYEMLLSVAKNLQLGDWKIVFVGPVEHEFRLKSEALLLKYPYLKNHLYLVGAVTDFEALCSWYNRAKIFCVTSVREGFPVVLPEAMYWANFVVSTRVSCINEILDDGKLGSLVLNEQEMTQTLQSLIDHPEKMKETVLKSVHKAEQQYIWTNLVAKLAHKIAAIHK